MSAIVKLLRPFTACDIGDALVKLKFPYGGFLDGIKMWSPTIQGRPDGTPSVMGEVVTVRMERADKPDVKSAPGHFADINEEGKIMFIQQPPGMYNAVFGGLMATRTKYLGAAGVVIDGRFRDIDEIQELKLPLFARSPSILGSGGFTVATEFNGPLKFNDELTINPGDVLVGDQDGVVLVPRDLADKVASLCQKRKEMDDNVLGALKQGSSMQDALKKFRS